MANERLMQLLNMFTGTMQGIGAQRQQASRTRAQMEMQAKDFKLRADYNKQVLADMKAARELADWKQEQIITQQAGQASVAMGVAQPGGIEGMVSTGAETQWEQTFAGMTPKQQADPAYVSAAFAASGGMEAMREDMPSATEILADSQAYAALSLGGAEIDLPDYMQPYAGNIDFLRGEMEKGIGREEIQWKFEMQESAFRQGEMSGFNEDVKPDEIPYPEGLEAGYEQFFYAGVRKTQAALKASRRTGGVGAPQQVEGQPLSASEAVRFTYTTSGEEAARAEAENQWNGALNAFAAEGGTDAFHQYLNTQMGIRRPQDFTHEQLHDMFIEIIMHQAGWRPGEEAPAEEEVQRTPTEKYKFVRTPGMQGRGM